MEELTLHFSKSSFARSYDGDDYSRHYSLLVLVVSIGYNEVQDRPTSQRNFWVPVKILPCVTEMSDIAKLDSNIMPLIAKRFFGPS